MSMSPVEFPAAQPSTAVPSAAPAAGDADAFGLALGAATREGLVGGGAGSAALKASAPDSDAGPAPDASALAGLLLVVSGQSAPPQTQPDLAEGASNVVAAPPSSPSAAPLAGAASAATGVDAASVASALLAMPEGGAAAPSATGQSAPPQTPAAPAAAPASKLPLVAVPAETGLVRIAARVMDPKHAEAHASPAAAEASPASVASAPAGDGVAVQVAVSARTASEPAPVAPARSSAVAESRAADEASAEPSLATGSPSTSPDGAAGGGTTAAARLAAHPARASDPDRPAADASAPEVESVEAAFSPSPQGSEAAALGASKPFDVARPSLSPAAAATVQHLAAEMARRLEGRSTRFELELHPADLGRVDVRLDVSSDGRVQAQLAFDNPVAAADLRARADELRRSLEQAGFQVAREDLSFSRRDGSGSGQGGFQQGGAFQGDDRPGRARAFRSGSDLAELADAAPRRGVLPLSALDVRV